MPERKLDKERLNIGNRIVVFIGPEGSGKTTIAKQLAEETGKPYISTGNTIRDLAANDMGPLGDECRTMFAENQYLDGKTLLKIMVDRFAKKDTEDGFILEGGLRTVPETKDFQKMLEVAGRDLPLIVIYLDIPIWTSFERLVTGPNARKRKDGDDTNQGVSKRLAKFYFQLNERLNVIKNEPNWSLIKVDGTDNFEKTYDLVKLFIL